MISFNKIRMAPEKKKKGQPEVENWFETVPKMCVMVNYDQDRNGLVDTIELSTWEQPAPSFWKALQDLAQDVNDICEQGIDDSILHCLVRVLSVSLSHTEAGDGITITALRKLEYPAPLVLNTPHLVFAGPEVQIGAECRMRLNALFVEAQKFLKGYRAQMGLFEEAV